MCVMVSSYAVHKFLYSCVEIIWLCHDRHGLFGSLAAHLVLTPGHYLLATKRCRGLGALFQTPGTAKPHWHTGKHIVNKQRRKITESGRWTVSYWVVAPWVEPESLYDIPSVQYSFFSAHLFLKCQIGCFIHQLDFLRKKRLIYDFNNGCA